MRITKGKNDPLYFHGVNELVSMLQANKSAQKNRSLFYPACAIQHIARDLALKE